MQYYSTSGKSDAVSLKEAVIGGLASDGGLYLPLSIPEIPASWFESISRLSLTEIAYDVACAFLEDDVPASVLSDIVEDALDFPMPLREVEREIFSLELYHGPTMAFKDVGARFMSRLMSYLYREEERKLNVIVATSGDTGSAVAAGFFNIPGINVFVLFPKAKVSPLQQKQITTWAGNIHAVEVDGSFDDCQRLAKQMLGDGELKESLLLTSANSINIARLIPQSFYYYYAYSRVGKRGTPLVFSVPSGNFGNLTGGLMARATGLPVRRFIAATNVNDIFPKFMETGLYKPAPSIQTISNAMDVGDPSNFARIAELMGNSLDNFRDNMLSYSYSDHSTVAAIRNVHRDTGYIMDPHGAVAYMGLKQFIAEAGEKVTGVFLETAHPAKFPETMKSILEDYEDLPPQLEKVVNRREKFHKTGNDIQEMKAYIKHINS
jgi:threonine synthase